MKIFSKAGLLLTLALCPVLTYDVPTITAARANQPKQNAKSKKSGKQTNKKQTRETSSSVIKQEQDVNKEIRLTQQQIEANEAAVKEKLSQLTKLEEDINDQKRKVENLQVRESQLNAEITTCEKNIKKGEATLAALRERYIASVKKMRVARKKANPLAFIFSSDSFYQAWRRMRYLSKFKEWRSRREKEIKDEIAMLANLNKQLETNKQQLHANLNEQKAAQQVLANKHTAQNEVVIDLKNHGNTLRAYLAQKQAEANALSAKVMNLIAIEQQEAREAEQRRKEAAEKAAKEKAAKEKAEREKAAKEKAAKEKAEREKAEAEKAAKEKAAKDKKGTNPSETAKTPAKPAEKENNTNEGQNDNNKKYAEARNRKPRSDSKSESSGSNSAPAKAQTPVPATGFESAKGSLPRPASGSKFSIISHFGRHSLPDLPDVMYDNPGIDAIVDKGSSAKAVYDGTVTGIYVLPGFSTVVIIGHGDYYTVYGNIGNPTVSKGDKVKQGDALGKLVSDPDENGRTTIHFEVYKNKEKLNPESWLR